MQLSHQSRTLQVDRLQHTALLQLEKDQEKQASLDSFHAASVHAHPTHEARIAEAVKLMDNDEHVTEKHMGMSSDGDSKLLAVLTQDRTGASHRVAEQILKHEHPEIKTTQIGTRARILANIARAGHGAAQASMLRLMKGNHAHISQEMKDKTLFNLVSVAHPHSELKEHVEHIHENDEHLNRRESATAMLSIFAAREHSSSEWRQRVHKKLHGMHQTAKTAGSRVISLAALGNLGDRKDLELFTNELADDDARVRAQAARSLRNIHGYDVNELLVQSLIHDPVDQVKRSALDTLLNHRAAMSAARWADICSKLHSTGSSSKMFSEMLEKQLAEKGINTQDVKDALAQVGTSTKSMTAVAKTPCTTCQKCLTQCAKLAKDKQFKCYTDSKDSDYCGCSGYWHKGKWNRPQYDRVNLPGAEQFFEPKFFRTGSKEGNSHVNFGLYGEIVAEACRPGGADANLGPDKCL